MISLHSMLAVNALPAVVFWGCIALMAVAFAFGFVKGFRKVDWNGTAWVAAGAIFALVSTKVPMVGSTPLGKMSIALCVGVASVGAVLAIHGVLAYYVRPRVRWINDDINGDTSLAEYGLEFEPEYLDYDGEHEYVPYGKRIYKTGFGVPCFFFRLLGGITCALNVGAVLAVLLGGFLMIVNGTELAASEMGAFLQDDKMKAILEFSQKYLLDFLALGLMMAMARNGYQKGLIDSLCAIVITVGGFAAVGLSFYLPFSAMGAEGFVYSLSSACAGIFASLGDLSMVLGKLAAGAVLLFLFSIALVAINIALKRVCAIVGTLKITRGLDSCLATVLYLLIGAALCVGVWFVLATFDSLGIFSMSSFLSEQSAFSNALFNYAKSIVEPFFAGL